MTSPPLASIFAEEIPSIDIERDRMRPLFFNGCSAWLHEPPAATPSRSIGVVLCAGIGREARCAYRPLRVFAEQLAAAGFPTLRYEHLGLGDSSDAESNVDVLPSWINGVDAAKALLTSLTGVNRHVLGGVRFGATFATLAAAETDLLLLLSPVLQGRSWLTKLNFAAMHFSSMQGRPAGAVSPLGKADFDADGLELSAATTKSLADIDLSKTRVASKTVILAANGKLTSGFEGWLQAQGARLRRMDFPGFDQLFLDPNSNEPPSVLFSTLVDVLKEEDGSKSSLRHAPTLRQAPAVHDHLSIAGGVERPITFGQGLRGVFSTPDRRGPQEAGVIFLSTGGDPRAGVGRFAATASRALAQNGIAALRFDFAGIGDSPPPPGLESVHVYETPRHADVDAALAVMSAAGVKQVYLVGISAGAYHAVDAIIHDPRIAGAFGVSPLQLVWRQGDSLAIGSRNWGRATRAYWDVARRPETWLRFLRGKIGVRSVLTTLSSRFAVKLARRRSRQESETLRAGISRVSARGGRICLIMGVDDASIDEQENHFGRNGRRFTRLAGMSLKIVPGLDHGLVYATSRAAAQAELLGWLADASGRQEEPGFDGGRTVEQEAQSGLAQTSGALCGFGQKRPEAL